MINYKSLLRQSNYTVKSNDFLSSFTVLLLKCMNRNVVLRILLISYFIFHLSSFSFAQNTKEFDRKWELAKGHYSDGNYDMALMLFKSLTAEISSNPYTEYANYYTALCYFHENKLRESRQYLMQLQNKYPNWNQLEEAKYLYANIEFENQDYQKALSLLDSIENRDAHNMKMKYLLEIPSVGLLKNLLLSFPNDKAVAEVYAIRLANQTPLFENDKIEIDSLAQKFGFNSKKLRLKLKDSNSDNFKDTFQIAVIYPFNISQLEDLETKIRNQFVLDHYMGLKLACDTLSKQGVQMKLHVYDTKNDTDVVKKVLKNPELKSMDLIIGSVYRKNMPFVSKFATENKIMCINPLSNWSKHNN